MKKEQKKKDYRSKKPKFNMRCKQRRIVIAPLLSFQKTLHDLYNKNDQKSNFLELWRI
jgi:hypothetical protein